MKGFSGIKITQLWRLQLGPTASGWRIRTSLCIESYGTSSNGHWPEKIAARASHWGSHCGRMPCPTKQLHVRLSVIQVFISRFSKSIVVVMDELPISDCWISLQFVWCWRFWRDHIWRWECFQKITENRKKHSYAFRLAIRFSCWNEANHVCRSYAASGYKLSECLYDVKHILGGPSQAFDNHLPGWCHKILIVNSDESLVFVNELFGVKPEVC